MRARVAIAVLLVALAVPAWAAEHPELARARSLYNTGDYDGAIAAAEIARADEASRYAAALVLGRSYLQRHRLRADPADLAAGRGALLTIRADALLPRDRLDLIVGLAQALYAGEAYGAAAELFDTALGSASELSSSDRRLLVDWWATARDREARDWPVEARVVAYERIVQRMRDELRRDPGSLPANYWLAVAARGAGDLDAAWAAAVAGWVRAGLNPAATTLLRHDLDRFVGEVLIPERVLRLPADEHEEATSTLHSEWEAVKETWGGA